MTLPRLMFRVAWALALVAVWIAPFTLAGKLTGTALALFLAGAWLSDERKGRTPW